MELCLAHPYKRGQIVANRQADGQKGLHIPFGGCRMGKDPKTSVTDFTHRVHGFDNLFIADPSVFPTAPSVDPSLSIMAFSYVAAKFIG